MRDANVDVWWLGEISDLFHEDDSRHNTSDSFFGHHGNTGCRPGSADFSHHTSSSSSPVNCRGVQRVEQKTFVSVNWLYSISWLAPLTDTFTFSPDISDRQVFAASLSTDDVIGLSQSQQSLSRSSTLPYDHIPQRAQPQHSLKTKARPHSPGSEMVTLEEFLQESNLKSPLMVI